MATSSVAPSGRPIPEPRSSIPTSKARPPAQRPKPAAPNTNAATQWPLYNLYPPGPEWPYSQAAPTSQEPGKGYDVEVSRLEATRRAQMMNQANGQLLDGPGGYRYTIFVTSLGMDMSLSGSYGQSQYTRDFYPRNFVQPSAVIRGQSPTQEDYGILCEFVHACQHKAVANGYQNLTQIFIVGRDKSNGFSGRGYDGTRTDSTRVVIDQPNALMKDRPADPPQAPAGTYYSQTVRGAHQAFAAKGYISGMPRVHRQFEYAVQWEMAFTIAAIIQGPFNDQGSAQSLPHSAPNTWLTMLQDIQRTGVTTGTPALVKQNNKIVRAASAVSINPLTPNFDPGGGSSTASAPGTANVAGTPTGISVPGLSAAQAAGAISTAISTYHVPSGVFYGMFHNETNLGANIATSSAGAIGPFQFEPGTASSYNYPLTNSPNLQQFGQQADAAARYLSDLYNQLNHSWQSALAGYNAGAGNIAAGEGYASQALTWAQSQGLPVN